MAAPQLLISLAATNVEAQQRLTPIQAPVPTPTPTPTLIPIPILALTPTPTSAVTNRNSNQVEAQQRAKLGENQRSSAQGLQFGGEAYNSNSPLTPTLTLTLTLTLTPTLTLRNPNPDPNTEQARHSTGCWCSAWSRCPGAIVSPPGRSAASTLGYGRWRPFGLRFCCSCFTSSTSSAYGAGSAPGAAPRATSNPGFTLTLTLTHAALTLTLIRTSILTLTLTTTPIPQARQGPRGRGGAHRRLELRPISRPVCRRDATGHRLCHPRGARQERRPRRRGGQGAGTTPLS